jgi:hypothetical protein
MTFPRVFTTLTGCHCQLRPNTEGRRLVFPVSIHASVAKAATGCILQQRWLRGRSVRCGAQWPVFFFRLHNCIANWQWDGVHAERGNWMPYDQRDVCWYNCYARNVIGILIHDVDEGVKLCMRVFR